jgi:hypothetical protein
LVGRGGGLARASVGHQRQWVMLRFLHGGAVPLFDSQLDLARAHNPTLQKSNEQKYYLRGDGGNNQMKLKLFSVSPFFRSGIDNGTHGSEYGICIKTKFGSNFHTKMEIFENEQKRPKIVSATAPTRIHIIFISSKYHFQVLRETEPQLPRNYHF